MRRSRLLQQPWWPGCLLLVLILLGHDGLMASAAYAASEPATADAVREHAPAAHPAAMAAASDDDSHPAHPSACGIAGAAVPSAGYGFDDIALSERGEFICRDPGARSQPATSVPEGPFWPPGTRRALLQTYRI